MEALEIVIFTSLTLMCGALVFYFMIDSPAEGLADEFGKKLADEHEFRFRHVDLNGFIEELLAFWNKHRYSDSDRSLVLYVDSNGAFDKEMLFEELKKANLCKSIQSRHFDCGTREDVLMGTVLFPGIVQIRYANGTLRIGQGGSVPLEFSSTKVQTVSFGGFEGNGDLRKMIGDFPADSRFLGIWLDAMSGSDFTVYFNGNRCNVSILTTNKADRWDLSECSGLLVPGENDMVLQFKSPDLFRKYIAGGRLTVVYESSNSISETALRLPDISGMVNYFGSVEIPGVPASMGIFLNYSVGELNGTDFYVRVGNHTLYQDKVSNHAASVMIPVPLSVLEEGTNPLRIGVNSNASSIKEMGIPKPVDVVLITDVSGSMACDLDPEEPQMCALTDIDRGDDRGQNCNHPSLMDINTQKLILAKCFGIRFADILFDKFYGNKLGLVSFNEAARAPVNLTNDMYRIETAIRSYDPAGGTCVVCSIDDAAEMLKGSTSSKAMVIMTDGVANFVNDRGGDPIQSSIDAAQDAHDAGITLYTIAFGLNDPDGIQLLQDIACIDNCSHFGMGNDPAQLQQIYETFANEIAQMQSITIKHVQGSREESVVPSSLKGSYVQFTYTPWVPSTGNMKAVVKKALGCDDRFDMPQDMVIEKAEILAWAGTLWAESLAVNGQALVDLDSLNVKYMFVGDPFALTIPPSILSDHNQMSASAGDIESENSVCLSPSTLVYTVSLPSYPSFKSAQGCNWKIDSGRSALELVIPPTYKGDKECEYKKAGAKYDSTDAFQYMAAQLFDGLDFDNDGAIDDGIERVDIIT